MGAEKQTDMITDSKHIHDDASSGQVTEEPGTVTNLNEAIDAYGDVATAEELGYVQRGYVYLSSLIMNTCSHLHP